jgi:hypothetical protein
MAKPKKPDQMAAQPKGKKARAAAAVALLAPRLAMPGQSLTLWRWTHTKREAVEMYCSGAKQTVIAKALNKGVRTVRRWCAAPEFQAACQAWGQDQHRQRKGRRVRTIGVISDTLTGIISNQLTSLMQAQEQDKGATFGKEAIAQLGMLLRENRELMDQERADFGDVAVRRWEGNFRHFFSQPQAMTVSEQQVQLSSQGQSFEDYVKSHIDPALMQQLVGDRPIDALIGIGRVVVSDPALVQELFDTEDPHAK